jgi:hypothetical protein
MPEVPLPLTGQLIKSATKPRNVFSDPDDRGYVAPALLLPPP